MDQQHASIVVGLLLLLMGGFIYYETSQQPESDPSRESAVYKEAKPLNGKPNADYLQEEIETGSEKIAIEDKIPRQKEMELSESNPIQGTVMFETLACDDGSQVSMSSEANKVMMGFAEDMHRQISSEDLGIVALRSRRIAYNGTIAAVRTETAQQACQDPYSETEVSAAQVRTAMGVASESMKSVVDIKNVKSALDEISRGYVDLETLDVATQEDYPVEGNEVIDFELRRRLRFKPNNLDVRVGQFERHAKLLKRFGQYQTTTKLLVRKLPLTELADDLAQSYESNVRFHKSAGFALQEATGEYLLGLYEDATLCRIHAEGAYSMSEDTARNGLSVIDRDFMSKSREGLLLGKMLESKSWKAEAKIRKQGQIKLPRSSTASGLTRGNTKDVLNQFLESVIYDCVLSAEQEGIKTVTAEVVAVALDREGR